MTREGRALRPESRGRVLSAFLLHYFAQYVDYSFTATLEDQLDLVSGDAVVCPHACVITTRVCEC